jgi:membrane fusion protein (multidrug efflux system)
VRVLLEDGSVYAAARAAAVLRPDGRRQHGQVTLRAEVPNPKGALLPGLYVRVRLEQATELPSAIVLPQQAVAQSEQGDTRAGGGRGQGVSRAPVKVGARRAASGW